MAHITFDQFGMPKLGGPHDPLSSFSNENNPFSSPQSSQGTNPFRLQDLEGTEAGQRTIFEQARPDFFQTGRQRNIFSGMFDRIMNDFLGNIGQDFAAGNVPSETFTDFVNSQDFDRQGRRNGTGRRTSGLLSTANFLFDK